MIRKPRNQYKVPKKQWIRWSLTAQLTFIRLYDFMMSNPKIMGHPKQAPIPPQHWKTIAWNSAWVAADAVDDTIPARVVEAA